MRTRCNTLRESAAPRRTTARAAKTDARGAALVTTLILLALLSAVSVATILMVSSDTMINGYYRNYRGSFYAADSGVNVVVQSLYNSILATAVDNGANGAPPLSVGGVAIPATAPTWTNAGTTAANFLSQVYSPYQATYYKIGDTGSWNGQFQMVANPDGNQPIGTVQFEVAPAAGDSNSCWPPSAATCFNGKTTVNNDYNYTWTFVYPYEITIKGQSSGGESELITGKGTITYTSTSGTGGTGNAPSFAKWAAFITNFAPCLGALVPGYMTGPFFTDGQWGFGNFSNPGYTFTGTVGQVSPTASWFPGSGCKNQASAPSGMKLPVFQQGFQEGQNPIVAPTNSYNQAQAVLDSEGLPPCTVTPCSPDPPPSQAQMNTELKTISGTSYPASGIVPTGVYIPYYTSGTAPGGATCSAAHPCYGGNTATGGTGYGGGFYVNGNASISLVASTGGDGTSNPTQTYAITQGATTTTIIVDNVNNTTTVQQSGVPTLTLQGTPTQHDPNTGQQITQTDPSGAVVNPTLVYVNGNITGIEGVVQNLMGITITASGNVNCNGNLTYAQEPVTVPADALVSNANSGVIGIYTATGNINLQSPYSNNNLEVDGSLAAIGGSCASSSCGFTATGFINTFNNVGGQIQTNIFSADMNAENTYYDQRFANNFGPPWFPTAVPQAGAAPIPATQSASISRASWQELRASQ